MHGSDSSDHVTSDPSLLGAWLALGAVIFVFLAAEFLYPRFADIDEIFFKTAGRNLSAGASFAAPELEDFLHFNPPVQRVFFPHPPVYSWLFGEMVKLAGFNWKVCIGYDAVISALLAVCVFGLSLAVIRMMWRDLPAPTVLAFIPAIFTLLFRQTSRPDELAMIFCYANLWLLISLQTRPSTAFFSGLLVGLTLCTSTGALLGFFLVIAFFWMRRIDRASFARLLVISMSGATLAVAVCLVPLYLIEPNFYHQFFQLAQIVVGASAVARMREAIVLAWQVATPRVLVLFGTLPLLLVGLRQDWRVRSRLETLAIYAAPLTGFGMLLFLRSAFTYWWFLQPWFVMIAVFVCARLWRAKRFFGTAAAVWLLAWISIALAWPAKAYLARCSLPPEQQIAPNEQRLRQLIPPNTTVLTAPGWWLLAADHKIIDPEFSDIDDLRRIDFFVADGNGTGQPGIWRAPANPRYQKLIAENFETVADMLPRDRVQVFGRKISNSAYGFGTIVMRRSDARPAGKQSQSNTPP